MAGAVEVAGDVVAASSAIAGLTLVFIGAISTSFSSYETAEQPAVRSRYQWRAWFAFVGFVLAILSTSVALVSKWFGSEYAAIGALILLSVALIFVLFAGLFAVLEIK